MKTLKTLDVEKVAAAIEADAGQAMPALREALAEAKLGLVGEVHTPEQVAARRKAGRPAGSTAEVTKQAVTIRMDPEALARWRARGKGWPTRAPALLAAQAPA